jgi:putative effector of murein hydrolase LrgA (UPF0299 family)
MSKKGKGIFSGTSVVSTIIGGLLTGMLVQWLVKMRSKKASV